MSPQNKIELSFGMIVLNGEPFIKYNLESLYPHAHEILIVEGAVEKFKHAATLDGHSLDKTVEIIKDFPDPQGKIKLIQRDGFWSEKTEMSNAYMEVCTGDYIWQVDVDEFYKNEDIIKIKKLLSINPETTRVDIRTINFWRGFSAVIQGASYVYGANDFIRIFKFKHGYRYLTHRPPTLTEENGQPIYHSKIITAKELSEKYKNYIYHYSYVFGEGVKNKSNYYAQMGWGKGCEEGIKWVESCWKKFQNPLRIHLIKFPPSWIVPYEEKHPDVIEKMIEAINYQENKKIKHFLKAKWEKYAVTGNRIIDIFKKVENEEIGKIKAALLIIPSFLLPINLAAIRANKTIFEVLVRIFKVYGIRTNIVRYFKQISHIPHFYMIRSVESRLLSDYIDRSEGPFLDMGCGDGFFGKSLELKDVYGIDIDEKAIKCIANNGYYKKVIHASASDIPFPDGFFTTVFSNCALEHMDDLDRVLEEVKRILKKGGKFIFTVPCDNFISMFYKNPLLAKYKLNTESILEEYNHIHHHVNILGLEEWRQRLANANFSINHWEYYLPPKLAEFVISFDVLYTVKSGRVPKLLFWMKVKYLISGFKVRRQFKKHYNNIHSNSPGSHLIIKAEKK